MWVLFGLYDDTVEQETIVYFIGIFDDLSLAKDKLKKLMETTTKTKRSDYIIKTIDINKSYNYDWSNNEEDEIK